MEYKRVLMLRFTNGMSSREIAETTGDGKTMVNEFLKRFRECTELSYLLPEEVHQRVYRERSVQKSRESGQFRSVQVLRRGRNAPCPDQKRETFKHLWKKYNVAGTMNGRRLLSYRQFRPSTRIGSTAKKSPSTSSAFPASIWNRILPGKRCLSTTVTIPV